MIDIVYPIKKEGKVKLHAPIYQNLEYHAWKAKTAEVELKEKSDSDPLRIAFGATSGSEEPWKRDAPRRNVSDSYVNTPKLLREIRGYLSSDTCIHSKFQTTEVSSKEQQKGNSIDLPQTVQLPNDSFASYVDAYKEPPKSSVPPAPGMSIYPYGGQYYNSYQTAPMQFGMPPGMYPNAQPGQAYVPIYIPVMMQPQMYPSYTEQAMQPLTGDALTGRIKFFDNTQNYGFFVLDCDGSDLFVHYDDFLKSGITRDYIQMAKAMNTRFGFRRVSYYGKYNLSSKAVDIQILQGESGSVC